MVQTKYEILKGYIDANTPELVRDSWLGLGGAVITASSRTFIKDLIYKVDLSDDSGNVPESAVLHGSLLLCEASLYNSDPLTWSEVVIEDDENGYVSFASGIISPHFRLLLTKSQFDAIAVPANPNFVPYTEIETADILITDEELEIILTEAGIPFILLEELEFPRNKICNLMIKPVMQEYFKFWPILDRYIIEQPVAQAGQKFEVEMPVDAYGAVRAFVAQGTPGSPVGPGNPMFFYANEIAWWGGGSGSWSPIRFNQGSSPGFSNLQGFATMALDRAARQGIINYATRIHFHIEKRSDGKKYLVGYANRAGQVEIWWAKGSNDWNDVEFARLPEVRKLATSRVLRVLGMLRSQVKTDIPGQVDYSGFIARAKELEAEVYEFWKNVPRVAIMRGGM